MVDKFKKIEEVYEEYKPEKPTTFFSNNYIINKFDNMLESKNIKDMRETEMRREYVRETIGDDFPKDVIEYIIVQYVRLTTRRKSFKIRPSDTRSSLQNQDDIWRDVYENSDLTYY